MSNESTNIIETMSAELEHLRPMEASLEMAEADVKAYKQRIAVLEKEVGRLQRYHDAEATKWLAENQKLKDDVDKVIAEKDKEIAEKEADYKEACDRLKTANLIKDEQKKKADILLSCLKYLVMGDLIKDCPSKKTAAEIVKEYDVW